jgi:hypothetical protein
VNNWISLGIHNRNHHRWSLTVFWEDIIVLIRWLEGTSTGNWFSPSNTGVSWFHVPFKAKSLRILGCVRHFPLHGWKPFLLRTYQNRYSLVWFIVMPSTNAGIPPKLCTLQTWSPSLLSTFCTLWIWEIRFVSLVYHNIYPTSIHHSWVWFRGFSLQQTLVFSVILVPEWTQRFP